MGKIVYANSLTYDGYSNLIAIIMNLLLEMTVWAAWALCKGLREVNAELAP